MFKNKEEYKAKLDQFAAADFSFIELLQKALSGGNNRQIFLTNKGLIVKLEMPSVSFYWNPRDPRTAIACLALDGLDES